MGGLRRKPVPPETDDEIIRALEQYLHQRDPIVPTMLPTCQSACATLSPLDSPGRNAMKMSARNHFAGTVTEVKKGQVMAQVTVDIGGGNKIMSAIFTDSAEDLALKKGDKVTAVIKSTDVIMVKG
jgi:molybdate transport system regulatory protein